MGTNYYAEWNAGERDCPLCGHEGFREKRRLHVVKLSGGWAPIWRAYWEPQIRSVADWKKFLQEKKARILDEYGEEIPLARFWEKVRAWVGVRSHVSEFGRIAVDFLDPEGNELCSTEFS